MTADDLRELARTTILRPWNDGDFASTEETLGETVLFHFRGDARELTREQMNQVVRSWRTGFPDFRFELEDAIVEGDRVALRLSFTGTHLGPFWGAEATGNTVSVTQMLICRFEGGRLVELWEDYDELALRRQLGML